jgi:hypothetical protein
MKATFKSKDPQEIKRIAKVDDLASFIWELKNNSWREFKHTGYNYAPYKEKIGQMLEEHNIDIDELWN